MVASHPWLFSATGELEQKLRISHCSYRTKQANLTETPGPINHVLKQPRHLWRANPRTPMITCHLYYLIFPIYVVFTARCWALMLCQFDCIPRKILFFLSVEVFFFFFFTSSKIIEITAKLTRNTEQNQITFSAFEPTLLYWTFFFFF